MRNDVQNYQLKSWKRFLRQWAVTFVHKQQVKSFTIFCTRSQLVIFLVSKDDIRVHHWPFLWKISFKFAYPVINTSSQCCCCELNCRTRLSFIHQTTDWLVKGILCWLPGVCGGVCICRNLQLWLQFLIFLVFFPVQDILVFNLCPVLCVVMCAVWGWHFEKIKWPGYMAASVSLLSPWAIVKSCTSVCLFD